MTTTLRIRVVLLVVPAALLLLSLYMVSVQGPYHLGTNLDPSYMYLMNALNLVTFHFPYHIDNPGTTVQELGGVVIFGKWIMGAALGARTSLEQDVLTHPDDYLRAINFALNVLIAVAVFAAGWTMYRTSGSLAAALVLQLSVFAFRATVAALPQVAPEPALIAAGFALMAPLIPVLLAQGSARQWEAPAAGVILAFGVIAKIIFSPVAAVGALFTGRKQKLRFAGAAAAAMFIFLLPALHRMSAMARWFYALAIHTGEYGHGQLGVPSSSQLLTNLHQLFHSEPFLFYFAGYYAVVLLALHAAPRIGGHMSGHPLVSSGRRLLWVGLAALAVQLALTLKHYAPRYMLPTLVLTALLNSFLVLLLSSQVFTDRLRGMLSVVGAALLLAAVLNAGPNVRGWVGKVRQFQEDGLRLAETRRSFENCVTIGYYGSSVSHYALAFGSEYSAGVHGKLLKELYSDITTYNMFGRGFHSFSMEPRISVVRGWLSEGRCVLAEGIPLADGQYVLPDEFALQPIVAFEREALFRLVLMPEASKPLPDGTKLP